MCQILNSTKGLVCCFYGFLDIYIKHVEFRHFNCWDENKNCNFCSCPFQSMPVKLSKNLSNSIENLWDFFAFRYIFISNSYNYEEMSCWCWFYQSFRYKFANSIQENLSAELDLGIGVPKLSYFRSKLKFFIQRCSNFFPNCPHHYLYFC